ncbi:phosphoribosyltransferase [Paeniglutamicibacter sp. MACA_103]|uniref:phosphoribosyltransferase n=1 Tax=Paeniglutamicibacter sp. MACA_103 TaxID=3377337 RepID=UPI0038935D60
MGRESGPQFQDRAQAGALLGRVLVDHGVDRRSVVLGLLRGGVPVAAALARQLGAELGALAVRKLGVPGHQEVAFGAIASYRSRRGRYLVPWTHRHALDLDPAADLEEVENRAAAELDRLAELFADFAPDLAGRAVVLCDDGLATGATMLAALDVVAQNGAAETIVAVPVAPRDRVRSMTGASTLIALYAPRDFSAVGAHYANFSQVNEEEVEKLLREARDARNSLDSKGPD